MENKFETIRSLSWNQPFGTLMLHGKIETRRNATNVRGKVLICTCLKPYDNYRLYDIAGPEQMNRMAKYFSDETIKLNGYAIGIAELVDSRLMQKYDEDACFVQYKEPYYEEVKEGEYVLRELHCWFFINVQRIEPFEWKFGKQGWGFVPESEKAKIKIIEPAVV